jgi:hypothetical protein
MTAVLTAPWPLCRSTTQRTICPIRFADEPDRLLPLGIALRLDDVVGVVEQDAVAALAGRHPAHRGRKLEPSLIVFQPALAGLGHRKPVAPQLLVGRAHDQPRHLVVVAGGDAVAVAECDIAHVGHVAGAPLPSRPEHIDEQALHEAWGHVYQEAVAGDVAEGQSLQVDADRLQGPALDHLAALGLQGVPEVPNKVQQATAACLLPA